MSEGKKSFWETLPGILTGLAGLLTAVAGLLALFIRPGTQPKAISTDTQVESRNTEPSKQKPRSIINVAGLWQDMIFGTEVHISQNKSQLTTKTMNPSTGQLLATGSGVLSGKSLVVQYRWFDGNTYKATLVLSDEAQTMTGSYRNPYTGEQGAIHLVRSQSEF